jgi:DNA-binding HxlR family transcriptional regulator
MVDPAELFEAISHPERIRILKLLEEEPRSFASMKRKLNIESSGNLDHHLKKLGQLVSVREDGLYGLTDAGNEALHSIEAIEAWTETKKRRIKIPPKIPKEVAFLGVFELLTGFFAFWFLAIVHTTSNWGYIPPLAILFGGISAAFGLFTQIKPSWKVVLSKSALTLSLGLFLLIGMTHWNTISQSDPTAIYYLGLVAAEAFTLFLAFGHPTRDFLGIHEASKIPALAYIASALSICSGISLISLQMASNMSTTLNFGIFTGDASILAGLTITMGGVFILLKSYIPGALLTIMCGLYPPIPYAFHAYDLIATRGFFAGVLGQYATIIGVVIGALPILGGAIALYIVMRRIR